ncbi:MAG: helix-turn-helix domain-containing protein [Alicyclobacillaceae bacterium]|nr:helix-turn-helix domain-containing protein [Alicyclobacillaceae bacterium]
MRELGERLRQARERLGMDLDEVEQKTKIRKRYLIALEEGRWDVLPGIVYARGFVRSYAECVGLDGRRLLEEYVDHAPHTLTAAAPGDRPNPREGFAAKPHPSDTAVVEPDQPPSGTVRQPVNAGEPAVFSANEAARGGTSRSWQGNVNAGRADREASRVHRERGRRVRGGSEWARKPRRNVAGQALAVIGILVVLGGGLWALDRHSHHESDVNGRRTATTAGPGKNAPQGQGRTAPGSSSQGGLITPDNGTGVNQAGTGGHEGEPAPNAPAGGNSTRPQVPVQLLPGPFTGSAQSFTVRGGGPITLQMTAKDRCWVQVTADGQVVDGAGGEIVTAGEPKQWQAKQTLTIRIGNVPAASLTVDGQAVPMPPTSAPVNLTFTKQAD